MDKLKQIESESFIPLALCGVVLSAVVLGLCTLTPEHLQTVTESIQGIFDWISVKSGIVFFDSMPCNTEGLSIQAMDGTNGLTGPFGHCIEM